MNVRITTGATEPISVYAVNTAGNPITGLTDLYVRIRRVSDGFFLDWTGYTFKSTGWTTLNKSLTEISATNAPGLYEVTGGLPTASITNPTANDDYQVIPVQTPGTNARLPSPAVIQVGKWVDNVDATISSRATVAGVWDELLSGHVVVGSAGATLAGIGTGTLTPGQVAGAVWDALRSGYTVAGSFGESVRLTAAGLATDAANEIRDAILSDSTPFAGASIAAIKAKTDNLPADPADESNQLAQHAATQAAIAALNDLSQADVQSAMTAQGYTTTRAGYLDRLDATITSRAAPGDAMDLVTNALDAAALAADAVTEIQSAILSDATPFQGARVDAAVSSRATQAQILSDATPFAGASIAGIKARTDNLPSDPADESNQLAQHTATQAAIAALQDLSIADVQTALTNQGYTPTRAGYLDNLDAAITTRATNAGAADAVWDELLSGHAVVGSAGKQLADLGAGGGSITPAQVTAAVWDASRGAHTVVGSFGESVALTNGGLATTAVNEIRDSIISDATPFPGARIDAAISTRATPGAAMDLIAGAVDANALDFTAAEEIANYVWEEPLADHSGVAGSTAQFLARLDATVTSRAAPGAAMALTANAVDSTSLATSAAQEIADSVWDEARGGHIGVGSTGEALSYLDAAITSRAAPGAQMALTPAALAATADAVLDETLAGHVTPGTTGEAVARLDVAVSTRAAPGAAMTLAANAVDSAAIAATGAAEIADAVWDEVLSGHTGVGSAGAAAARVDVAVSSRAAPGDAMDLITDAVDANALAASAAGEIADAVWEEPIADHSGTVGSTAEALNAAGGGVTPAQVADAVWDELLAGHVVAGSAGEAAARLDAAVTTRAAPGDAMTLTAPAVAGIADGVWDESLAGHVVAGSAGATLGRVDEPITTARTTIQGSGGRNLTELAGSGFVALTDSLEQIRDAVAAVANTVRFRASIPELIRPEVGTRTYKIAVTLEDTDGHPEDPDANTINVHAQTESGASLDANLSATTMTRLAVGVYEVTYSVASTHPDAQVRFAFTYAEAAVAFTKLETRTILDGSVAVYPTTEEIADAVWDELTAGHVVVGSTGVALARVDVPVSSRATVAEVWEEPLAPHLGVGNAATALDNAGGAGPVTPPAIAVAVWDELSSAHTTPGTVGAQVQKIDVAATEDPATAAPGSLLDRLCNKDGSQTYDQATDSLEAVRDRIG
jgi:hypothetical protein